MALAYNLNLWETKARKIVNLRLLARRFQGKSEKSSVTHIRPPKITPEEKLPNVVN